MGVKFKLTFMSFLQFFIWGAWLITVGNYWFATKQWNGAEFGAFIMMDFSTAWPSTFVENSVRLLYTVFEAFEDENERLANQLRHFWHRRNFLYRMVQILKLESS